MHQETLPGMPEPTPEEEPEPRLLSSHITIELSFLTDGGGALKYHLRVPDTSTEHRMQFIEPGTSPAQWIDRVNGLLFHDLAGLIEPF
jgi:hypothetical protein